MKLAGADAAQLLWFLPGTDGDQPPLITSAKLSAILSLVFCESS